MFRSWSPVYDEEENYLPYDDFDPLKEWLVHPDYSQLQIPSDLNNTSVDSHELNYSGVKSEKKDQILESMEKVSLLENSDNDHIEVGLEENKGEADGDMKCMTLGLEDLKNNKKNEEGIIEGVSAEKEANSVQVESDSEYSSSDESISDEHMSVAKSLSSSEDEDDVGMKRRYEAEEFEEGEVMEFDVKKIDFLSDEEEEGPKGPIHSKHELEVLPPVPKVEVTLKPDHQLLPVGVISSLMSKRVIVEGSILHNPLNEGSVLWITDTRLPVGLVDEIFGPVKNPYYVVRYNTEEEVPAGISVGTAVSFAAEFANQILNKELYKKGYDASGENDEEVDNEVEFSDDEKEAEYRKSLREAKRASNQCKGVKQESKFERKRSTFMGPKAQHKDTQKQPNCAQLCVEQPYPCPAQPQHTLSGGQSSISPGSWSFPSSATNVGSVPPPATPQFSTAIQAVNYLGNPSQQLLTQHQDTPWQPGFSPQLQNTGLQNQNVVFNNLVNMMAFQQMLQQFVSHQGSTLSWASNAPSLQTLGQNNFAPFSFNSGFMNVPGTPALGNQQIHGQVSSPLCPSMQFNAGSSASLNFNGGNSRGRRPYQRGGGRFIVRGGRQPR